MNDEKVRLFAALELPDDVRLCLVDWRAATLAVNDALRPVGVESLHVTLCFLGSQAASAMDAIAAACASVAGLAAASLSLECGIWLPRRRPRVLAVRLRDEAGRLARVQARLATEFQAGGWYEPEGRPFLPHVTVGRVRGRGGGTGRRWADELPAVPERRFQGGRVTLFRSRLKAGGAEYEALSSVELDAAP